MWRGGTQDRLNIILINSYLVLATASMAVPHKMHNDNKVPGTISRCTTICDTRILNNASLALPACSIIVMVQMSRTRYKLRFASINESLSEMHGVECQRTPYLCWAGEVFTSFSTVRLSDCGSYSCLLVAATNQWFFSLLCWLCWLNQMHCSWMICQRHPLC